MKIRVGVWFDYQVEGAHVDFLTFMVVDKNDLLYYIK